MSMDIKKGKNYKLVSYDFEKKKKGKIDFAFHEPEPITKNEHIDLVRETLQASRRYNYKVVSKALLQHVADIKLTEINEEPTEDQ
jgi:hypothetical protein